jgi:hypothetical protein
LEFAVELAIRRISPSTIPGDDPNIVAGDPDFSVVTDVTKLPPMPWKPSKSIHADFAWETPIPGTDYALKLYQNGNKSDRSHTITIVKPTEGWGHWGAATWFFARNVMTLRGLLAPLYVNSKNADNATGQILGL